VKTEAERASEKQCFSVEISTEDGQGPRQDNCMQMLHSVFKTLQR